MKEAVYNGELDRLQTLYDYNLAYQRRQEIEIDRWKRISAYLLEWLENLNIDVYIPQKAFDEDHLKIESIFDDVTRRLYMRVKRDAKR